MPTVNLNKQILEKLLGKKLTDEELKDRISMLGTDLEKIEEDDIVVEVFPNRPDMLSEQGFARALSSFIGAKTGLRKFKINQPKDSDRYTVKIEKSVEKVRPYTACAIVKKLNFNDEKIREIVQLQEKLHITFGRHRKKLAIGIYPLEMINLPITYKALKPEEIKFRPLEAPGEMTGSEILESHPTGKEYAHLLEGFDRYPVFVDALDKVLSMPPIINSHETGKVTDDTKEVFIECSGFDFKVLNQCLNIIVTSLAEMGGEIYQMTLERQDGKDVMKTLTPDLEPQAWKLDIGYVKKMIGLELREEEVKDLLERMGYGYDDKEHTVLIPAYRTDILHQIDLAEDIAIAYGYEKFEAEIPNVMTLGEEDPLEVFKNRIANILVGMGLVETISYNLSNKDINNQKMLLDPKSKVVELANSQTIDRSIMRSWVLPSLMQILSENTNKEYPQELFELGTGFVISQTTETGIEEVPKLAVVIAKADSDFTSVKQVADELLEALELKGSVEKASHPSFIPGRCAKIVVRRKEVGVMGEIHPQVLENFGIQMPGVGLELDIRKIYELVTQ
ncbi:phenylalanine--tRNA ligase subunit beta [Candidatus Woesearchaeota archaeon]|nr:phenylalanine--tRNA ligase subunit beta [Candidatus Woesearchaeota archaeon]